MGPLFLTGATGFIGRRFLERLPAGTPDDIRCLVREPGDFRAPPDGRRWQVVPGDLTRPATWEAALEGAETVLHLAAVTGKARPEAFRRVNVEGTHALAARARAAGVRRFILVSSIAAGFPDQRNYPYAASKRAAEEAVLAAGMDALVIRPTMVLGPGSPVLASLGRLAALPVGVVFGTGQVPVQPIHVDDLVALLAAALTLEPLGGRIVDAGGPVTLPLVELLQRLRVRMSRRPGPIVHLPLALTRAALAALEPLLFGLLPFTSGQLGSFANGGTARPDPVVERLHRPSRGIDDMLAPT